MRKTEVSRADLERLAGWLVVEFPDLRPFIGQAVDVVEGVFAAAFWKQARKAAECQVEVPFAARLNDSSGASTVVRGVIDLVYGRQGGWQIVDYKTDQAVDAGRMVKYSNQVTDYGTAWSRVTLGPSPHGSIFLVRTGRMVDLVGGSGTSDS
jgi:ATP-dependent exoDNAse (exonuclease V) beta subunit